MNRQEEEIIATGARWHEEGNPIAVALVAGLEGSGYRKPGARLLVGEDGSFIGLVSGGCLEQDIIDAAQSVQQSGDARMLEFDTRPDDDILLGWGSGCRGLFHILLHRPEGKLLRALHAELEAGRSVLMGTVVHSQGGFSRLGSQLLLLEDGTIVGDDTLEACLNMFEDDWPRRPQLVALDGEDSLRVVGGYAEEGRQARLGAVFVETMRPAPRLLIIGAGDDVPPVVDVARTAGLRTAVLDHRPVFANRERFPGADDIIVERPETIADDVLRRYGAVVVMTHQFELDQRWLARLSSNSFKYIGVLGPLDRTRRLLADSDDAGTAGPPLEEAPAITLTEEDLYGPIGLDIGGEGPGPIAVSIVSEILAVLHGRGGRHLKDTYEANKRQRARSYV